VGRTGCTVIIAPDGAVGGVDVRGAASSTLCTDSLRPTGLVDRAHAVLLAGGSAFGLEAAGGVMRYLEEHSIGYELVSSRVPIVAGAVIFDLPIGDPRAWPTRESGYAACAAATATPEAGSVGAGTGASVAKGGDGSGLRPGGLGIAAAAVGAAHVAVGDTEVTAGRAHATSDADGANGASVVALMVVNAVGGIWDDQRQEWVAEPGPWDRASTLVAGANTTIGVVATDAQLTKEQANRLATVAHDGIARAIRPSHTMYDGDTIFCMATGAVPAPYDAIEAVAVDVVAEAIAGGVRSAQAA
jgi:L-aminopeptidase/D-esterase-like protein